MSRAGGERAARLGARIDDLLTLAVLWGALLVAAYLAFALAGCSGGVGDVAEPLVVVGEDAAGDGDGGVAETGVDGEDGAREADAADAATADARAEFGAPDTAAPDTATPPTDTAAPPTDTAAPPADSAPADSAPADSGTTAEADVRDAAPACPGGVYCTHATGAQGRVGAACFYGTDCCSGYCFDPVPGDGVKGSCYADSGAPGWCGSSKYPEWCPDAVPEKVCRST